MQNIYLIGFMGTGKTTIAKKIQSIVPYKLIEMDETLEMLLGMSIPEIFETKGEEFFRDQETMLLKQISMGTDTIVSCGGGVCLRQENIDLMKKSGKVFFLDTPANVIFDRIKRNDDRPLAKKLNSVEDVQAMLDGRMPMYEKALDVVIDCKNKSKEEVALEIIKNT